MSAAQRRILFAFAAVLCSLLAVPAAAQARDTGADAAGAGANEANVDSATVPHGQPDPLASGGLCTIPGPADASDPGATDATMTAAEAPTRTAAGAPYLAWALAPPDSCSTMDSSSGSLFQRPSASTDRTPTGEVPAGGPLAIACQLDGQSVSGASGTSTLWDRLGTGEFVSDAYAVWPQGRPDLPWCSFASGPAPTDRNGFLLWAGQFARLVQAAYHVPASVSVAQAILESGWGRSGLTTEGNNFFGAKCFGRPGPVALGCRPYPTRECGAHGCYPSTAGFRMYASARDSFADHAEQLWTLSRYRAAFAHSDDPARFAVELQRAGYATSARYSSDLIALMERYDLYRYDRPV